MVSSNLKTWQRIRRLRAEETPEVSTPQVVDMAMNRSMNNVRFFKIVGKNQKVPEGYPGAGDPAWIFIDEISIH